MKIMDFLPANCKNCYKCVRNCSVKAIRITNDQAEIIEDRCIACGQCFVVCPQNARNIISDLSLVKDAIASGKKMIASIAPSFAGIYKDVAKFKETLYRLGFDVIEETAVGAQIVTEKYKEYINNNSPKNLITSCCPSVNLMIERYYPKLIPYLIPIESPMVVHSKILKKQYGNDCFVTFIGPCISKKQEAFNYKLNGEIDAVISFEELENWITDENISTNNLSNSDLPSSKPSSTIGKQYPIERGILKGLDDLLKEKNYEPISISGLENCKDFFQSLVDGEIEGVCVEANTCLGGCIGGPAVPSKAPNLHVRNIQIKKYIKQNKSLNTEASKELINTDGLDFSRTFVNKYIKREEPNEEELKNILKTMGKFTPEDELNCGACGYNTCREKAKAVFQGMSHPEMCIPFMRSKAERVTNTIFEHSPNIIFLLDENLNILEFNPIAEKTFYIDAKNAKGKPISFLLNDDDFRQVQTTKKNILGKKVSYLKYDLVVIENILYIPDQKIYLTILYNLTEQEKQNKELVILKQNTLATAENIIQKQMRVAQEIASLLGETTAETKVTLLKLQQLVKGQEGDLK